MMNSKLLKIKEIMLLKKKTEKQKIVKNKSLA